MAYTFLVTGLPRSRTGWLANLFTWGSTFCLHDGLSGCSSLAELKAKMEAISARNVGNSDSGLAFIWRRLNDYFPDRRTVFVIRNVEAAWRSYIEYFWRCPYGGMSATSLDLMEPLFYDLHKELIAWMGLEPNQLRVAFDSLDDPAEVRRMWEFITDEPWNARRFELLNKLRINPASEKLAVHPEKFVALLHEGVE